MASNSNDSLGGVDAGLGDRSRSGPCGGRRAGRAAGCTSRSSRCRGTAAWCRTGSPSGTATRRCPGRSRSTRIFSRIISATMSLASALTAWSAKMPRMLNSSPASHASSKRARRSSSDDHRRGELGGSTGMPPRDSFAALRYAARSASRARETVGRRRGRCARGPRTSGVRWNTVSCRGLRGDERDGLHARRAGADDRDSLAGEVDALVRPAAGEVDLACEPIGTLDVDLLGHRQAAGGHDVEAAGEVVARVGVQPPERGRVVPHGSGDARREVDVAPQVVPLGDELEVSQDLGLGGVLLGPRPLALELGIEAVRVVGGRDVTPSARIAVPVPRAADVVGRLEDASREARARGACGAGRAPRSPHPRPPRRSPAGSRPNRCVQPRLIPLVRGSRRCRHDSHTASVASHFDATHLAHHHALDHVRVAREGLRSLR